MSNKLDLDLINAKLSRLKEILEVETEYLRSNDTKKIPEIYEEKLNLLQELEEQKRLLREKPAPISKENIQAMELEKMSQEMDSVIEIYGKELIKAREVNKFMMDAISRVVQDQCKEVGTYDAKGYENQYLAKGESTVPPMKVNNTF